MPPDVPRLRRLRDRGRNAAFLGFGLMFFGGIVARYGNITLILGRPIDVLALFGFVVALLGYAMLAGGFLLFVGGCLLWARFAIALHRAADPWAYDPDLDGPDPAKSGAFEERQKGEP